MRRRHLLEPGIVILVCILSFFADRSVLRMIPYIRNPVFDAFFTWISSALLSIMLMMFIMSVAMWQDRKRKWILPLWLSVGIALFIVEALKVLFMRDRPMGIELTFLFIRDFSFPSAHAAICFAMLPILDSEYPHFKSLWIGFAALVAFSRIYLGVHYLSDVVAGAAIGYLIGKGVQYIARRARWKSSS